MNRRQYGTDLSDYEWQFVKERLPPEKPGATTQISSPRDRQRHLLVTRSGCKWRLLQYDFPPWWTVYFYFRLWKPLGILEQLNADLRYRLRMADGREPQPSAAVIDSQSVKTTEASGDKSYDVGKKISGRKRHVLVDILGLLLKVVVHPANVQDRDGGRMLLEKVVDQVPRLARIWADGAYAGRLVEWTGTTLGAVLEIVKRNDDVNGVKILPRRWVVERTFAWLGRNRRMGKDYERTIGSGEAFVYISMVRLMLRRF